MAGGIERQAGVARVWSDAIARLAAEAGSEDQLLAELEGLVAMLERAFRGRTSDLFVDLLQVLRQKGRLDLLRALAAAYRGEWLRRRQRVEVLVTSAVPLGEALRAELRRAAASKTGREPVLVERVDPAVLGGLVVRIGDDKFDGSVARELGRLEEVLLDRASRELHAGKSYFEETA